MEQPKEYYAFISYKREDEKWAKWLQDKLEHYKFPTNLNGRSDLPKHIRPTFRDVTDLSPEPLEQAINNALRNSEWLIVVCSPRSAKSPWVCKEAQTFIDLGREEHIIPFVIEGNPFSSDTATECYPEALLNLTGSKELLAANINEMGRDAAVVKVVARMFGLKFDTLWQRHEREQIRKRWMWMGGSLLLAVASLSIGGYIAWQNRELDAKNKEVVTQRDRANSERDRANSERDRAEAANISLLKANDSIKKQYSLIELQNNEIAIERDNVLNAIHGKNENQSRYLAKVAKSLIDNGDSYLARRLSEYILTHYPYTIEAEDAMIQACSVDNALLHGHTRSIIYASFLPGHDTVISVSRDKTIRLWDAYSGKCLRVIPFNDNACRVACVSHDGKTIVLGIGGKLFVWDIKKGTCIKSYEANTPSILKCSYSCNDKEIAFVTADKNVYIWNVENDKCYSFLNKSDRTVNSACLSPDGKKVICLSYTDSIFIYNISDRRRVHKEFVPIKGKLAIPSIDNKRMLIANKNDLIIYNYEEKKLENTLPGHTSRIYNASYSLDGKYIISSSANEILVWETRSGKIKNKINKAGYQVSSSFDNSRLLFIDGDYDLHLVNLMNDLSKQTFMAPTRFYAVSCSPDGRDIASASDDDLVRVWDSSSGRIKVTLMGHAGRAKDVEYSPDGRYIASASDNDIRIWDVTSGMQIGEPLKGHTSTVNAISFSPNGRDLVSVSWDGTVRIWNIHDGTSTIIPSKTIYYDICYSPDGSHYVTADGDGLAKIWDLKGNCIKTLEGDELWTTSVSYDHSGKYVVSTSRDGTVRLWNATSGECLRVLRGHTDTATSAIFSNDGKYIISTSYDQTIKIWRVETGNCLQTLVGHESNIMASTLASDGRHIISASWDGSIKIWDFPHLRELMESTNKRFKNRQLTPEERRKFYLD